MNKTNKAVRGSKNNKSMKGKKGTVGAPKKAFRFPRGRFTILKAAEFNDNVCELTARKRVNEALEAKTLTRLLDIPQASGAVGRPERSFMLTELVTADTKVFGSAPTPKTVKPAVKAKGKAKAKARKVAKTPAAPQPVTSTATVPLTEVTASVVTLTPAEPVTPVASEPTSEVVPAVETETASNAEQLAETTAPSMTTV